MKLRFKEEPKEWRKAALLVAGAVALLSSLLRWRRALGNSSWLAALAVAAVVAGSACLFPQWFRGYYRFQQRLGFYLARGIGFAVLSGFFVMVIVPMGVILRLFGQDPLRLKRTAKTDSYWVQSKPNSPLDRMF